MSFDPYQFLEIANDILDIRYLQTPGGYRTSVNRVYYASFLYIRKFIQEAGIRIRQDYNQHEDVITILKEHDYFRGDLLYKLRRERNKADYNLNANISNKITLRCIKYASNIFSKSYDFN